MKRKICIALIELLFLLSFDVLLNEMVYQQFYFNQPLLEISLYLLFIIPVFLFKKDSFSLIYFIVVGLIFSLYTFAILMMYETTGELFKWNTITLIGIGGAVLNESYIPWKSIVGLTSIYAVTILLLILTFVFIKDKNGNVEQPKQKSKRVTVSAGLAVFYVLFNSISLSQIGSNALNSLKYEVSTQSRGYLKKHGTFSYLISDLFTTMGFRYVSSPYGANDDIDSYTDLDGICKDYNVITIMVESGAQFLMNETLTPNLYSIFLDGINMTNNKSKNKTNVSEFIGIAGVGSEQATIATGNVKYNHSIVSLLNELGYTTSYFHDNTEKFYERRAEMTNLNFQNIILAEDVDPDSIADSDKWDGSYALDSEFVAIDGVLNKMIPDQEEPFYTFFTTFSTHGPYWKKGNNYSKFIRKGYYSKLNQAEKEGKWTNICADDELEIQEQIKYLTCAMMDFDAALGKIINRLKSLNLYENTIFCIYGDHENYYKTNGMDCLSYYIYNTTDQYDPRLYSTLNIISNPTLKQAYARNNNLNENNVVNYTNFTSPYVIVPSLLNILGIEYSTSNYTGLSIFEDESKYDNIFYSHELKFYMTDDFTALSKEEIVYSSNDSEEDLASFTEKLELLMEKIYNIDTILINSTK